MFEDLEKLLYQRFLLHSMKFALLKKIKIKRYFNSVSVLGQVHLIIKKEVSANKKICKYLEKKHFNEDIKEKFVNPICFNLSEINKILLEESNILYKTNFFMYSILGKKYFKKKLAKFKVLTEKEIELNRIFFDLSKKLPKNYQINEKEVKSELKLLLDLQEELKKLRSSIGNSELVQKHGEKVLVIAKQVQKTEIYGFIEKDVNFIREKVGYVVKHPNENKLIYFLTAVYVVAPLTFEMTGAILFFKYLGKYTISKAKKFRA